MSQMRVFVSHSHQDDAVTSRIVADLRQAGATVWVDVADIGAGDFQQRINDALASCEYVVLVLTKDALASPWVQQEINAAIRLKHQGRIRDILPIQAGPVGPHDIPPLWGVFNIFDANSDFAAAMEGVIGVLSGAPSQVVSARPKAAPEPGWKTATDVKGLLGAALAAQDYEKDYPKSVAILERATQLHSGSVDSWEKLAHAYEKVGQHQDALNAWRQVLTLRSGDGDSGLSTLPALFGVADNLKHLGRERETREANQQLLTVVERWIRISPRNSYMWWYKSQALRALGREREAEKAAKQAEKIRAGG